MAPPIGTADSPAMGLEARPVSGRGRPTGACGALRQPADRSPSSRQAGEPSVRPATEAPRRIIAGRPFSTPQDRPRGRPPATLRPGNNPTVTRATRPHPLPHIDPSKVMPVQQAPQEAAKYGELAAAR
jgi:hypothetical protein